jgi:hypothetical protein
MMHGALCTSAPNCCFAIGCTSMAAPFFGFVFWVTKKEHESAPQASWSTSYLGALTLVKTITIISGLCSYLREIFN